MHGNNKEGCGKSDFGGSEKNVNKKHSNAGAKIGKNKPQIYTGRSISPNVTVDFKSIAENKIDNNASQKT
jgi:hypothetical protein